MPDNLLKFEPQDWVLPELLALFSAPETSDQISYYLVALGLEDEEKTAVFDVIRRVVIGSLPVEEMASGLVDRGFDFDTALEAQGLIYANFFADVEDALLEQRRLWLDLHPSEAVGPSPMERDPALEMADQCVANSGFKFDNEAMTHRLRNIVAAFLKDVRDEAETVNMLEKPSKTGGMELPAEKYAPLMLLLKEAKLGMGKKLEELDAEKKAWAERFERAKAAKAAREAELVAKAPAAAPLIQELAEKIEKKEPERQPAQPPAETPEEKKAVPAQPEKPAPQPQADANPPGPPPAEEAPPIKAPPSEYSQLADGALQKLGLTLNEDDLRRYHNAADLYFRDLRDSIETKSKFTMPAVSGGLGLLEEQANQLIQELGRAVADRRAALKEKVEEERKEYVAGQVDKMMGEEEKRVAEDSHSLDRIYEQIAAKAPASTKMSAPTVAEPKPAPPKFIPVISLDEKKAPPATASQAAPAAPSNAVEQGVSRQPKQVSVKSPATAPPPVTLPTEKPKTAASVAPARPGEVKPTVSDVKFTPRLVGPVEELKSMAPKDFRRLSREPHEATLKIKDKIDLLAEQSFEARTAGVKAWQDSETNRLYLDMLRKSLEGKPISDIISEREAANEPVLTKLEFDAIMELNRKLRFG